MHNNDDENDDDDDNNNNNISLDKIEGTTLKSARPLLINCFKARYRHFHEKWVLHRLSENWKGPFSKDIFSNFTPFLCKNKEKSELKFTPFFLQNKDIFRNLTPFSCKIYPIFQIKSNQIKIKYLLFESIWTPLYNLIIKTLAWKLTLLPCLKFQ